MINLTILLLLLVCIICITWLFFSLAFYFVPVIVAYVRKHNNIMAISILTIFLGWTFAGWLAALLWALNSDTQDREKD